MEIRKWQDLLRAAPQLPDLRAQLATLVKQGPSPFAEIRDLRAALSVTKGETGEQTTLITASARKSFVLFIDRLDVRYDNPANETEIDERQVALVFGQTENVLSLLPERQLQNFLCDEFGAIDVGIVAPREQDALLLANYAALSGIESYAYEVRARLLVRYEPQWLCEALGLVEPYNADLKGPA